MIVPALRALRSAATGVVRPVDAVAHERVRLRLLFAVALLKFFNFLGGAWDIQWHVEIGRDSLWIPPHLTVFLAFVSGVALVLGLIAYETLLASAGQELPHGARLGPLRAPPAVFGVFFGYNAALLSGMLDEGWHRAFGIDATLWSPPHLLIMLATMVVDYSLMLGIFVSARRLGYGFTWNSPLAWGVLLAGAYAFEAIHFQMSEAFIVGYRGGGAGLAGLLYPLLLGAFLPFPLLASIGLSRRFWIGLATIVLTLVLQYVATWVTVAGFAILQPVSVIEEYVRANPDSTAAVSRAFAEQVGARGVIGFYQAGVIALSTAPLALVALLGLVPAARRRPLLAAPLFAAGIVLVTLWWYQQVPALRAYPIGGADIAAVLLIAAAGSLASGSAGLRLARSVNRDA